MQSFEFIWSSLVSAKISAIFPLNKVGFEKIYFGELNKIENLAIFWGIIG
jgi:hypothetical protein